ncbi:MAG: hypothetical protein AB1758_06560, partial [Candidatus Eremiobacterota bacterium]
RAPFGWMRVDGTVVGARQHLQTCVRSLLELRLRLDAGGELPVNVGSTQKEWLDSLGSGRLPEGRPRPVAAILEDLTRLGNVQRQINERLNEALGQFGKVVDRLRNPEAPPPVVQAYLERFQQRSRCLEQAELALTDLEGSLTLADLRERLGDLAPAYLTHLSDPPTRRELGSLRSRILADSHRAFRSANLAEREFRTVDSDPTLMQVFLRRLAMEEACNEFHSCGELSPAARQLTGWEGPPDDLGGYQRLLELSRQSDAEFERLKAEREDARKARLAAEEDLSERLRRERDQVGGSIMAELVRGGEDLAAALDAAAGQNGTVVTLLGQMRQAWQEHPGHIASLLSLG